MPAIELQPPDITPWREGNSGVPYVHVLASPAPGPTVMVQAITHGNELCGAIALDALLRSPPRIRRGRLVLAFGNVDAYQRFDPARPHASRCVDEDLNRVWADDALDGPRDSVELRRARALRPFVDAADLLLDIHSMTEPCRPLMVCGTVDKNAAFARELGMPADLLIDTGHPAGLRMIERGGLGDPASPRRALLIECGQHWEAAAADVAVDGLMRFLALTGVVEATWALARTRLELPARQRVVRVTEAVVARSTAFEFLVPMDSLGTIAHAGTPIARDGDHVWRAPYDGTVLVMPSLAHCRPGNTMVRLGRWED
ncbi:MAG: succinylglutamate desuccinylase/aspartoacylase family protein [Aquabacterium sp.]